jgi:hypothetical protein
MCLVWTHRGAGWHGQTCLTVLVWMYFVAYEDALKLRLGVASDVRSFWPNTYRRKHGTQ